MTKTKQQYSFDPSKVLLYKENIDAILDWKPKSPIEVSVDPVNICQFRCEWCNGTRAITGKHIPKDAMLEMLENINKWGSKAVCLAGGGEVLLYQHTIETVEKCAELGLESALITNGYLLKDKVMETCVKYMRWIGISVDAANRETFKNSKKVDGFNQVIENIKNAVLYREKIGSKVGITFKFLIYHGNYKEIFNACLLAKGLGCDSFHARPVDYLSFNDTEIQLDVHEINRQIEKCLKELKDDTFEVVPLFLNFNKDLKRKIEFDKCELSPLLGLVTPTGWWLCVDRRGHKGTWLCEIDEIRSYWGSEEHLKLINKINPKHDCGKCTLAKYHPYFHAYRNDWYYWRFV